MPRPFTAIGTPAGNQAALRGCHSRKSDEENENLIWDAEDNAPEACNWVAGVLAEKFAI
jgi:hypothetical protein